jgi:SAM-dependent methyltransferase
VTFETSHTDVEARMLAQALRPGARVLDAGCGRRTRLADHRDRIAELVGVDVDAAAGAENRALDQFFAGDLCDLLPFEDACFDLVYANFVVEHLDAPAAAFREWRRVLRPDGALILLTSNRANPMLAAAGLVPDGVRTAIKRAGAGVADRDVIPTRYRANTPKRLAALLVDAGFQAVEVRAVATLHRYAERKPALARLLRGLERCLPPQLRSTIVAWYAPAQRVTERSAAPAREAKLARIGRHCA